MIVSGKPVPSCQLCSFIIRRRNCGALTRENKNNGEKLASVRAEPPQGLQSTITPAAEEGMTRRSETFLKFFLPGLSFPFRLGFRKVELSGSLTKYYFDMKRD